MEIGNGLRNWGGCGFCLGAEKTQDQEDAQKATGSPASGASFVKCGTDF